MVGLYLTYEYPLAITNSNVSAMAFSQRNNNDIYIGECAYKIIITLNMLPITIVIYQSTKLNLQNQSNKIPMALLAMSQ